MKVKFPVSIKRSRTVVKIYQVLTHSGKVYSVDWRIGKTRKRKAFADFKRAKSEAETIATELSRGEAQSTSIDNIGKLIYTRACNSIKEVQKPLDVVAEEYSDAVRKLQGIPLSSAIEFYLKHHPTELPKKTVQDVLEEMLSAKAQQGLSEKYLKDLRSRCGRFASRFVCQITSITSADIEEFLNNLNLSNRSHNNYLQSILTLFEFGKSRGYLQQDHSEVSRIALRKKVHGSIEIFSPEEIQALLTHADAQILPVLLLGAFCGIRTAETMRLNWENVHIERRMITIDHGIAKTAARRVVPISENLAAWLTPNMKTTGKIWNRSESVLTKCFLRTSNSARLRWKHNALRHSYISYRVAMTTDLPKVAYESGNSVQIIKQHYLELVGKDEAKRWFDIFPSANQ